MKKVSLLLLVFFAINLTLYSDTILLCMSENTSNANSLNPSKRVKQILEAYEDGAMDVAFESGFIVTNSRINECKRISGDSILSEKKSAQVFGKNLGVDYIMFIKVLFPDETTEYLGLPVSEEYSMFNGKGEVVFKKKQEALEIKNAKGLPAILDAFTEEGARVAAEMLFSATKNN